MFKGKDKYRKKILEEIKPLRNRIYLNRAIDFFASSLAIAASFSTILVVISLSVPIASLFSKIITIYLSLISSSIIVSFILRPSLTYALKIGKHLSLGDGVLLSQQESEDVLKIIKATDFKSLYPLKFPRKETLLFLILTFITIIIEVVKIILKG